MFPCLWLLSILLATVTSTLEVRSIISQFESKYHSARTLQTTFLERYLENGHVVRVEAGTAYFLRPGKMRWEYESPEKNLFLVDGKTAWFYVPADHTVTRVPAKKSADWRTPLALLAGETNLSRFCQELRLAPEDTPESPENAVLHCTLRGAQPSSAEPGISSPSTKTGDASESVIFEVVKRTGVLVRIVVRDPGGVTVEFHFANWVTNPQLSDSLFHFTVPANVAIVNGELH